MKKSFSLLTCQTPIDSRMVVCTTAHQRTFPFVSSLIWRKVSSRSFGWKRPEVSRSLSPSIYTLPNTLDVFETLPSGSPAACLCTVSGLPDDSDCSPWFGLCLWPSQHWGLLNAHPSECLDGVSNME